MMKMVKLSPTKILRVDGSKAEMTTASQIHGHLSFDLASNISDIAMDIVLSILFHNFSESAMLKAHMLHAINRDKQLVVCEKCNSTYKYSVSIMQQKEASFVRFPRHPQARIRTLCGTLLIAA